MRTVLILFALAAPAAASPMAPPPMLPGMPVIGPADAPPAPDCTHPCPRET
jgi:hypothetical protein